MFVVCDVSKPLSEGFYYRGSYIDAILLFDHYFPSYKKISIYSDLRSQGQLGDLRFIDILSKKQVQSLIKK